ncbi:TonB-dependent receptor [Croceicoccus estronivorus]|uniref:TonB-dependent receptor n=1 Tax=Croceicoccus estronivorus TaxID=1172626 RepID=UPI00082B6A8C|nr:TonB-dependent receptor [Croceicoccus estronivorus]OCC22853.1 TonB-dependent receptor [Croceicoccus estronivorus]
MIHAKPHRGVRGLTLSSACLAILAVPLPALAQEASDGKYHDKASDEIIVTAALPSRREDMLSSVAVVQGPELTQALRASIGETLDRTPGVSATSFGPTASRPVLRGLQGERVRLLTDGIGSIDVSNTSADHAAAVNPLLAERIEVLRGPQSLLYGSSAIGGVVNVIDSRIPVAVPDEPIHIGGLASYGSAANERSVAGTVDVPIGGNWVAHADGSYLKSDNMRIGGHALTPALRQQALDSAGLPPDSDEAEPIDFAANAAVKGKLPNSASETWAAGAGLAYIGDQGNFGVSYSHYDSLYGIPVRFATEPGQEQEAPRLDLVQNRFDARAELETGGNILDKISFRGGYAKYRHYELEEDGGIGTAFYNRGFEGRLELTQAAHGAWHGVTGAQYSQRRFNVVGDEAFLPRNQSDELGLFTFQQLDYGALKLEGGLRYERSVHEGKPTADQPQFFAGKRSFDTLSGSLGGSYAFAQGWRFGLNLSRTSRAPAAEELFANGPHAGTEAYEIGDPGLSPERSWGVEAILRGSGEGYSFEASAYHSWFTGFIYQTRNGEYEDGLPVYETNQSDARYYGFEVQGSLTLAHFGETTLVVDALADYVHATIKSEGPAPRIPPLRMLGGLALKAKSIDGRLEVERVTGQDRVAQFETSTPGFTLVNAELNWRPWGDERPLSFALSANNIFDVVARRHASFLKDYAPLTGRDIRITARVSL